MLKVIQLLIRQILQLPAEWVCRLEYQRQVFTSFNERPLEFAFAFSQLAKIFPPRVLDVGSGTTAWPHIMRNCGFVVTAIDNISDYWASGYSNRHYHIIHDDITQTKLQTSFDAITCLSVLEHIENHDAAIKNMFNLLTPQGQIILTFPYSDSTYIKNVYDLPGSNCTEPVKFITQSFSRAELNKWLHANNGEIVHQAYWQCWDGDYWSVGKRVNPPLQVDKDSTHQLGCFILKRKSSSHEIAV